MRIRPMLISDLPEVLELCRQLGYDNELPALHVRYLQLGRLPEHGLFVTEEKGEVVGFLHLRDSISFIRESNLEVVAIVVENRRRGKGYGKELLAFAQKKAKEKGYGTVFLSSRDSRTDSHRFYEAQGFSAVKKSFGFQKDLGS